MAPHNRKNYLLIVILWIAALSFLLPSSVLAANHTVDVSIFNYVLGLSGKIAQGKEIVVTTTISSGGFDPVTITVPVERPSDCIELRFHAADSMYTVTRPSPPFQVLTVTVPEGQTHSVRECFQEVVTGTVHYSFTAWGLLTETFVFTLGIIPSIAPPTLLPVGGTVIANPTLKVVFVFAVMLACFAIVAGAVGARRKLRA